MASQSVVNRDQRHATTNPRIGLNLGLAAVAAILAVILAVVRSRRTGLEVGLVAVALGLFGLRDLAPGSRRALSIAAWVALLAVAALALEPHVH
jgi:hypothetical protein